MAIRKKREKAKVIDISQVEYVIYCRKSSEDSSTGQKQSIVDQLNACLDYAKSKGLFLAPQDDLFKEYFDDTSFAGWKNKQENQYEKDIIERANNIFYVVEEKSAKIPNNREKRSKLIKLVKEGKIKGILSYAPDRQARNLPEAGEIVQLLDQGYFDVKYTNFTFENNPSGRMVLGITFVISYNYSDNLGKNIGRGNEGAVRRGTSLGKFKHGYIINDEMYHEPDPDSFDLWKKAFQMKLYEGKTDKETREYLVSNGYKRKYKNKTEEFKEKNIYTIWVDEFYYGLFICGDNETDLRDSNPYYKPIITEQEYSQLLIRYQSRSYSAKKIKPQDEYYDLKPFENGFVVAEDGRKLTFNLPSKHRYIAKLSNLKKTNSNAILKDVVHIEQMKYSSSKDENGERIHINADVIDNAIYVFLQDRMKFTEDLYKEYSKYQIDGYEKKMKENTEKKRRLELQRNKIGSELDAYIVNSFSKKKSDVEEKVYDKYVKHLQDMIDYLNDQISDLSKTERNTRLEADSFFKILKKAPDLYKRGGYVRKRKICNLLLSNIVINKQKGLTIMVKPGLESMFSNEIPLGGDDGIRTRV